MARTYECEEGCSKCCGPKTFIALTSSRVIIRNQSANCCSCCCNSAHIDTAVYLRDIEVLEEAQAQTTTSCGTIIVAIMTCTWPCLLMAMCCGSCCGDQPKYINVRGGFGSVGLIFKIQDALQAVSEITSMIHPLKDRR